MSDSNRRRDLTVGLGLGILAGLFVGGYIYGEAVNLEEYARYHPEYYTDYYQERTDKQVAVECVQTDASERAECAQDKIEAAREESRKEYDLEAQGVMAAWTRAMGQAALVAMFVGLFGLGLLYTTFREARRAANAGFQANEIAQESQVRQLRAYLTITRLIVDLPKSKTPVTAGVEYANRGQTPAKSIRIFSEIQFFDANENVPKTFFTKESGKKSRFDVGPSETKNHRQFKTTALTAAEAKSIRRGQKCVLVSGFISYKDFSGKTRRTAFKGRTDETCAIVDGMIHLTACETGNSST